MSYVPPALRARASGASMRRDNSGPGSRDGTRAPAIPAASTPPPSGELEGWSPSIRQPFGPPTSGAVGFEGGVERKPAVPTAEQVAEFKDSFKKRQEARADSLVKLNKAVEKQTLERKTQKEAREAKAAKAKADREAKAVEEIRLPPVKFPNTSTLVFFQNIIESVTGDLTPSPWSWWRSDNGGPQMHGLAFMAAREDVSEDQFLDVWTSTHKADMQRTQPYKGYKPLSADGNDGMLQYAELDPVATDPESESQQAPGTSMSRQASQASEGERGPTPEEQLAKETEEARKLYRVWQRIRQEGVEQNKPALLMVCNLWDHGHQPLFVNNPPTGLKNQSAAAGRVWGSFNKNNRQNADFIWRPMRGIQGPDAAAVDATGIGYGSREDDVGLVRMVDDPLAEASAGEFWVKSFAHSLLPAAFQAPWNLARKRMELSLLEQQPRGSVPRGKLADLRRKLDELEYDSRDEPLIAFADEMFTRTWYFNNTRNDAATLLGQEGAANFNRPIPFFGQQVWFHNNKNGNQNNTKGLGTFLGWYRITSVKFVAPGSDELRSMQRLRFGRRNKNEVSSAPEPFWARFGVAQIPNAQWPYPSASSPEVDIGSILPEGGDDPPSGPADGTEEGAVQRDGLAPRKQQRAKMLRLRHPKTFKSLTECESYEMFIGGLAPPSRGSKRNTKNAVRAAAAGEDSNVQTPEEALFVVPEPYQEGLATPAEV